ncbi:MAG: ABC transporter substrate-binding protein [Bacteroidota bacterium]|nr:ABC transporter substrate-binding protein [Bacteroidota bacterium]MDX5426816.1 ABC transporter substrate-binding protein [Bacteroidota bacterium]MDX5449400.1 ABC transporter substrate-binding protein [Bacteroidota bacterium]MDX5504802.1 ABC transporter substrate-binding protein [Bacteroidota bacterium]
MKRSLIFLSILLSSSCGRFSNEEASDRQSEERWVGLSKQYNEILYALGAQDRLVAVDLSSTYPPEIKELPTVGYHRALSAEGVLGVQPTLILHDNNVGPEQVMEQLRKLEIPEKVFEASGKSWEGTQALILEMGRFTQKESQARSLVDSMVTRMTRARSSITSTPLDSPSVVILHYGRAMNIYLTVTAESTAGTMVRWAGGKMAIDGDRGMRQLSSPELIAKADPDVILVTNFGYDRLEDKSDILQLPGVALTKAAKNGRIYRIEEHDLIYFGPRTPTNVMRIHQLLFENAGS